MTTYYFSSTGSDGNSGTTATAALRSLNDLSSVKLHAGDSILLARGSEFNSTLSLYNVHGTAAAPITISSYGTGSAPIIDSPTGDGIRGLKADYIDVANIAIMNTGTTGLQVTGSSNWVIHNVLFDHAGGTTASDGSINFYNSTNISIDHDTITQSYGDGVFMRDVSNVSVTNSLFKGVHGPAADNVQIEGDNTVVSGNALIAGNDSAVTKGNLVFQGDGLYAHDNFMQGGSFGISVSANNVVIDGNTIRDHAKYNWSEGVGFSDEKVGDVSRNLAVTHNDISGSPYGVSFDGKFETVKSSDVMVVHNLNIAENRFHDWTAMAVKVTNVTVDGTYDDNVLFQRSASPVSSVHSKTDIAKLSQHDNIFAGDVPVATPKTVTIVASADLYQGAPTLLVYKDGVLIEHQGIAALKSAGQTQAVEFKIVDLKESDTLSFRFANDKYNATTHQDRNLYIQSISIDGSSLHFSDATRDGKVSLNKGHDLVSFTHDGSLNFTGKSLDAVQNSAPSAIGKLDINDILTENDFLASHPLLGAAPGLTSSTVFHGGSAAAAPFDSLQASIDHLHHVLATHFG